MEKKIETTIVYWGNMGIMEKKMETIGDFRDDRCIYRVRNNLGLRV